MVDEGREVMKRSKHFKSQYEDTFWILQTGQVMWRVKHVVQKLNILGTPST